MTYFHFILHPLFYVIKKVSNFFGWQKIARFADRMLKKIKTGMKVSRGQTAYARIKNEFNLKGNKQKVLDQFIKMHDLT